MFVSSVRLVAFAGAVAAASAFAPVSTRSISYTRSIAMKGADNTVLFSSTAEAPADTSTSTSSSQTNNKAKSSSKKQRNAIFKNIPPKQRKSKGKQNSNKSKNNNRNFKPLKDLVVGSIISGTVVDVCDFGAFVNIGYATRGSRAGTALLHISQISNERITNIHDMMKVGDVIEGACVIGVDIKKGEVGLSLRTRRQKRKDFTSWKVGDEVEGKVDSLLPYGAFIDIGANVNGLLHISRVTGGAIENIRHHLNEGDSVSVHIIDIDTDRKTMAVSMLDKKADQYLSKRMNQRMKKYYGKAAAVGKKEEDGDMKSTELDYFDQAIKELEEALREKEGEE
jgi:ribosomal protein S1